MLGGMSGEKEDQKYIPWHVILAPVPQISQKTKRKNGKRIHESQISSTFFFSTHFLWYAATNHLLYLQPAVTSCLWCIGEELFVND